MGLPHNETPLLEGTRMFGSKKKEINLSASVIAATESIRHAIEIYFGKKASYVGPMLINPREISKPCSELQYRYVGFDASVMLRDETGAMKEHSVYAMVELNNLFANWRLQSAKFQICGRRTD